MKKLICFLSILFFSVQIYADNDFLKRQKKFVKELYLEKKYFDAIAEARRLSLYDNNRDIEYFIYMNYYLAGQYKTVVSQYGAQGGERSLYDALLVSMSYFNFGMFGDAYDFLLKFDYGKDNDNFNLFLNRAIFLLHKKDMEKLEAEFAHAKNFLQDDYNFLSLREELQRFKDAGLKSPAGSACMSAIVPGLGQVYSGYIVDGIISFAAVLSTAMAGSYFKSKGEMGYSYTAYFFSGLFYAGNIYGAYNGAEKRNNKIISDEYNKIKEKYGSYNPEVYIDIEKVLN